MKKVEEEARAALEDESARLLQKTWNRHCEWEKMRLRFCLRRKVREPHEAVRVAIAFGCPTGGKAVGRH